MLKVVGTKAAAFTSAAVIAHQVTGKAARDALFLTSFPVSSLPLAMAAGAVLSLVAAIWVSRLLARYSPAAILPVLFALNMSGLVLDWALSFVSPGATAIAVFLQTAVSGPVLISAFWSLINERFDPHSARRAIGRIALGGTIGGVVGALMAWRMATLVELPTMVLVLAAMQGACLVGTLLLRSQVPRRELAVPEPKLAPVPSVSTVRLLGREPYLRSLALLVAGGATMSGLLDYLFSRQAAARFDAGPDLLTFFSLFWLAVAVLSMGIQLTVGQRSLVKLGVAANVAILPVVVILGGGAGLVMPGFLTTSILRGAEAVQRNTLFRSAYELLYTPLSEAQKRSVKAQIDIGFDRIGTIAAAGLVMLFLAISVEGAATYLLVVVIVLGVLMLPVVYRLHAGYVTALEHGLRDGATKLALPSLSGSHEQPDEDLQRERLIQRVELLRPRHTTSSDEPGAQVPERPRHVGPASLVIHEPRALLDPRDWFVGEVAEVARQLRELPLETTTPVTGFLILLLAHDRLHTAALEALRRAAPVATGQLIDALIDPEMDFVVRRRIPSALSACTSQRAADGLLLGIGDERFEVRYACGRALMKLSTANPGIVISRQKIVQSILIEVDRKAPGAALPEFEADPSELEEASALVDNVLAQDRVDRTLEHVFTILGLHLEREPMRMAYRALRHPDVRHRGTALEYLQTILPHDLRDAVWPLVGELAPLPAARSAREILADLLRATVVQTREGGERD